jgi:hypothetical protein
LRVMVLAGRVPLDRLRVERLWTGVKGIVGGGVDCTEGGDRWTRIDGG